jgi:hypothetical protein
LALDSRFPSITDLSDARLLHAEFQELIGYFLSWASLRFTAYLLRIVFAFASLSWDYARRSLERIPLAD